MKSNMIVAAFSLVAAGSGVAYADAANTPLGTVVELYTSQGCSSCPPADAYLQDLSGNPGVIALALHVDYWDYIGWTDKFGSPKNTERQKDYAHAAGANMIYTPQMIVGGVDMVEGTDRGLVEGAIRKQQAARPAVALQLARHGGTLDILAQSKRPFDGPLRVQLVRYHPAASVKIEHGENAGRVLDYTNIVTSWSVIGQWDGQADLHLSADVVGTDPVVVILQTDGPGRIIAAAQLK